MMSPIDAATWTGVGVAATLVAAFVAHQVGFLQISIMRDAHALNVAKAIPKVGCSLTVEEKYELGETFQPFLYLRMKIYNEGDLAAQSLNGQWKLFTPESRDGISLPLHRDFLGRCENYIESHRLADSPNWRREGLWLNVEVDFYYLAFSDAQPQRCRRRYKYDPDSKRMVPDDI